MVYTSATLSLAVMELLVHLDEDDLARAYVAVPADIPESVAVARRRAAELPRRWQRIPAPAALADIGRRWAEARETAVLAVPSAIIPHELNYLLNPRHPQFGRIRVGRPEPFAFDPRIQHWSSGRGRNRQRGRS